MTKPTLPLSQKNARHIDVFRQYSQLTGIPLDDVLDECMSEYTTCTIETAIECMAERSAQS